MESGIIFLHWLYSASGIVIPVTGDSTCGSSSKMIRSCSCVTALKIICSCFELWVSDAFAGDFVIIDSYTVSHDSCFPATRVCALAISASKAASNARRSFFNTPFGRNAQVSRSQVNDANSYSVLPSCANGFLTASIVVPPCLLFSTSISVQVAV